MPKHTPGPWSDDAPDIVQTESGDVIAQMSQDKNDEQRTPWPEEVRDANQRLMVAAPDLLSACRLALASLEAAGFTNATVKLARAAIAKAGGR